LAAPLPLPRRIPRSKDIDVIDLMSKKNPLMSMWLSGVNAWAGAARGLWTAELHRQQTAMIKQATEQMIRFWTGAWMIPGSSNRGKNRR
jgi:hypothetical protein